MSGVNVSIKVDLRRAGLRDLAQMMSGPQARTKLNLKMGLAVREVTRSHVEKLAESRHTTADRLGASHSGHLADAWHAIEAAPVEANADSATLIINHAGLGRAFHDVTIVPTGGAKALTIPINAIAYARRARESPNLFVFKSKTTGNAFLAQRQAEKSDKPLLLYLLVRSVTQKQDRTLLPADQEWEQGALQAAHEFFEETKARHQGGAA